VQPTARGLAQAVTSAVRSGSLAPEDRLPPIRQLAVHLGLSPSTVSASWSLLCRSGVLRTNGRRGTFVTSAARPGNVRYRQALVHHSRSIEDFSTGLPDPTLLPDLGPSLLRLRDIAPLRTYLDPPVLPDLVDALRTDWPYVPERITLADGSMDALDAVLSWLLQPGDRVAVEHPSFPPLLDRLEVGGAVLDPVPLDDQGPVPAALAGAIQRGCVCFVYQPRGQNPTGVSLSQQRRAHLATLLGRSPCLIIENDSLGGVAATPMISMGELLPQSTIHVRSFSKSHGPDLRLAALSGPAAVIDPIVERRHLGQGWSSRLLQAILLDLLTSPESIAQVAHARREYQQRRDTLLASLARQSINVPGKDGLNVWVAVADEHAALTRLAASGVGAAAGAPFSAATRIEPHIRVTSGLITAHHDVIARQLARASVAQNRSSPISRY